jgi:hypothetical protein
MQAAAAVGRYTPELAQKIRSATGLCCQSKGKTGKIRPLRFYPYRNV